MDEVSNVTNKWPELKGIVCPNPANHGVRSLKELKKSFNIEAGCEICLRCMCGRLLELPKEKRNPDCVSYLQDSANDTCNTCDVWNSCAMAYAYPM